MGWIEDVQKEIPVTEHSTGVFILLLNICLPGTGTLIMSFIDKFKCGTFVVAVLQILTFWIILGWIWSIWWGVLCYQKCK